MTTQADLASAERMSLDSGTSRVSGAARAMGHPAYTTLRNHAMECIRCSLGDHCMTGESLARVFNDVYKRMEAAGHLD
jgi:hypothetical protein